ncbi:hypothetical protein MPUL_01920 [Mycolicibacterium pulveris]|uniref:Uncharacterized protein n=1 Tax=Mycolicibacterium pulveris TaxID=36813 RepID=A0A7I7UC42_MYCPV|nr:hypothetical protein MPUL_01920 [Mycolicibacterium pulveris]
MPESTNPSQPASTRRFASRAAVAVSRDPSGLNGVTIAVSTVPTWPVTSNALVLTALRYSLDPEIQPMATYASVAESGQLRLRLRG